MANRRFGGVPPQKLGGFPQQNFQGSKMSPWQGGAAPNNAVNSGLSQLSASQQLALALTNLLHNQPQVNNNPPSLLSLPTTPAYNNQDNFGSDNRFNRGRDFRRPEPYNKNRSGGWRDNSTRPTGSFGGRSSSSGRSTSRSSFGSKDRKSPQRGGKGKNDGKNQASGKGNVKASKATNDSSKTQQKDADISNDTTRDEENADADETNDQDADTKNESTGDNVDSVDLTDENSIEGAEKKDKKPREGRYHGVPSNLLHCFVCNKSMWDGESFQNHVRGKAHKQMMDSLGQSFQITVNILRENMRLVEEKKMIELERMHRNSRNYHRHQQEQTSHCNMCDLKFLGKIIAHRKTEGHQRLKRFLHPKCLYCNQEFPSRMEWVDHRFTPDHLRKIKEIMDTRTGEEDGASLEEETPEIDNDPLLDESLQTEDENPILELTDDLKDLHNRIPAYKPTREIAKSNVQPMSGFYCDICIRFMTSETAAKDHLKTEKHYHSFVDAAKRQFKRMADEEKEKEEKEKAKRRKAEEEAEGSEAKKAKPDDANGDDMYDPEEACQENDNALDTAPLDEEFAEVDRLIKTVEEEEEKPVEAKPEPAEEEEEEENKKTDNPTGRGRRGGSVRNGAGPRSKTRRGGK